MIEIGLGSVALIATGSFLAGAGIMGSLAARRRRIRLRHRINDRVFDTVRGAGMSEPGQGNGAVTTPPLSTHLVSLFARAIREPLVQLRRSEGCPPDALLRLERLAWQTRMVVSRPRPMQAKLVSPMTLLQEAAEEVPILQAGQVGASWSLMNRRPVQLDPDRARAAFREILTASAESCGEGGRLAIRIAAGTEDGYPVQVEIEIGQRGAEADPLSFLVARHLLETQGARVDVEGGITRIRLRTEPAILAG